MDKIQQIRTEIYLQFVQYSRNRLTITIPYTMPYNRLSYIINFGRLQNTTRSNVTYQKHNVRINRVL